jgi:hypothetical protein
MTIAHLFEKPDESHLSEGFHISDQSGELRVVLKRLEDKNIN